MSISITLIAATDEQIKEIQQAPELAENLISEAFPSAHSSFREDGKTGVPKHWPSFSYEKDSVRLEDDWFAIANLFLDDPETAEFPNNFFEISFMDEPLHPIYETEVFAYFASEVAEIADAICHVNLSTMQERYKIYSVREDAIGDQGYFEEYILPKGKRVQEFLKYLVDKKYGLIVNAS